MNTCSEDQCQCHNKQYIPIDFYNIDRVNPNCLGGSDEWGRFTCMEDPTYEIFFLVWRLVVVMHESFYFIEVFSRKHTILH